MSDMDDMENLWSDAWVAGFDFAQHPDGLPELRTANLKDREAKEAFRTKLEILVLKKQAELIKEIRLAGYDNELKSYDYNRVAEEVFEKNVALNEQLLKIRKGAQE